MPQLADEYTREPEAIARERRLRAMLNAPIQAIPSGYGSVPAPPATPRSAGGAVPRTALPAWVQARLDAQEAERRRQAELAAVEAAPRVQVRPPAPAPPPPAGPRSATVKPSSGSLADDAALHDPRTRAQRLREILDAPMQGIGAGIGTYADPTPQPRPVASLTREQEEALFEPALRQERQAARDEGPSAYNALRSEQQLWEVGLAGAQQAEVGSESAYERAKNLVRLDEARRAEEEAERAGRSLGRSAYLSLRESERLWRDELDQDFRASVGAPSGLWDAYRLLDPTLEPLPDPASEGPWILAEELAGVPVTVDRKAVHIAYRIRSGFGATNAEGLYLEELPEDERERVEGLADEFWLGAQALEFGQNAFGGPLAEPRWADDRRIFELATGQPYPDVRDEIPTILRTLLRLRDGRDVLDDLTASGRNGTILIYTPEITTAEEWRHLADILGRDYTDEQERYEAVRSAFRLTRYEPDRAGAGTALREWSADNGLAGELIGDAFGKASSPVTWLSGPAGAYSIAPSVIGSNLYDFSRDLGLPPLVALLGTSVAEAGLPADDPRLRSYKAALWAYARDLVGERLDAYGDEWGVIPPGVYPDPEPVENVFERRRRIRRERHEADRR